MENLFIQSGGPSIMDLHLCHRLSVSIRAWVGRDGIMDTAR